MELDLGLALPTNYDNISSVCSNEYDVIHSKKSGFDAAFEEESSRNDDVPTTLHLLLWDKQPNEEDNSNPHNLHIAFDKIDGDEDDGIVGWPPIKVRKSKKHCGRWPERSLTAEDGCAMCIARPSIDKYVKVKMEGVAIARKINLSLYHSLPSLKHALLSMFDLGNGIISSSYKLSYQDGEGDWLLAQDVPWRSFIESAQRLRLIRSSS